MKRRILILLCMIHHIVTQQCSDSDRLNGENLALRKKTEQSSTWTEAGFSYTSSLAIDGDTSTDWYHKSCSHTDVKQARPAWWSVDLGQELILKKIIIFNRADRTDRLTGASVIGYTANGSQFTIKSTLPQSVQIEIDVKILNPIRNVTIVRQDTSNDNIVNICEVQVFELITCPIYRLDNGYITVQNTGDNMMNYTYCANLALNCKQGYELYPPGFQSPTTSCQRNGTWTILVHCKDVNECSFDRNVCNNNGQCNNTQGSFICQCVEGYTGKTCDADVNECSFDRNVCNNNGQCNNTQGSFICQCVEGYTGKTCDADVNECSFDRNVCNNNGQCNNTQGSFICQCVEGYTGKTCDADVNECSFDRNVCNNNGQCNNTQGSFICQCVEGYTGKTCDADVNECSFDRNVCNNNGQCNNTQGSFICQCVEGYTGKTCDADVNECSFDRNVCNNNGQCNNTQGSFICQCVEGYTGKTCDADVNECSFDRNVCNNNGQCNNTQGSFICQCVEGYTGKTCDADVNECSFDRNVCNNNGQCNNTQGSFICQCVEGYTGKTCDAVIRCDEILQPDNSIIAVDGGVNNTWTYNTTVSISCNEGYTLNGENHVRCGSAKQWNGSIGYCAKIPDAMNSMQSGSAVAVTAGGAAAAVCVVVIGIIIGVILYRRKNGHRAKTDETAFDDLPSSSEKITHKERDIKENVIYSEPMERKDHVCSETDHVYKNTSERSEYCYSYQPQNIKDKHTIQLKDLSSFFLSRKLEPHMFEEEYNTLPQGLLKPHYTALLPENRKKNRYKNMYAYDETRVQLEIWDPVTETDYINACYVNVFKDFRPYIASQGPTKDILNDFWRMIWQRKSSKIVMLTNLMEDEKHKCEKYWPDEDSIKFGFITIRLVQIESFSDFTIRTLELKKERFVKEKGKVEPHLVKQFHFTAWPDKGVPRYASSLVHFRQKVRNTRVRGSEEGPTVVHCSAGIGRTGTFLALDYLVDEGEKLGYINVFRCVETLRKQRVNLVQTVEQYVFLHEALVEALSCITSAMSTSSFRVEYKKLLGIDTKTRKRRLDLQYEELLMYVAEAKDDVYANANSVEHREKNRYSNILPDQNHSPYLNIDVKGCETYINAVFVPAYKEKDIFIITQTPLEDTKVDFWRMVYQFEVSSIVMLNTLKEMKAEERYWPENEESIEISPFRITLESKSVDEICVKYTFVLQYHGDHRKVRLSRATYWADNEPVPKSPTEMLKQIKLIQSWQQETGNKPIIVHCMNGAERSGLFCVVAALLERTKIEQDVAVEQIIKQMRSRRPQVIPNVDQFKFCYDAVLAFLDLYEEYSNFTQL